MHGLAANRHATVLRAWAMARARQDRATVTVTARSKENFANTSVQVGAAGSRGYVGADYPGRPCSAHQPASSVPVGNTPVTPPLGTQAADSECSWNHKMSNCMTFHLTF
jgi:hypothetical protein